MILEEVYDPVLNHVMFIPEYAQSCQTPWINPWDMLSLIAGRVVMIRSIGG